MRILRPAFGIASATAIAVLLLCAIAAPYTVDDAFIVLRYAQNIARGAGYALNPGQPSDGVTGPLWLSVPLFAELVGLPVLATVKLAGAACAAIAAWLVIAWQAQRALGRHAAWASAVLLVCLPDFSTWAVAGLETPLAALALTVLAIASLGRPQARPQLAGVALAAVAWLRPELVPAAGVLWLSLCFRRRSIAQRALLGSAAIAVFGIALLVALRLSLFGDFVPLSARAKPADLANGLDYVLRCIALWSMGLILALLSAVHGTRRERWLCAALLTHLASVVLAGGDWMPGARLIAPVLPIYALLVGRSAMHLLRRHRRSARSGAWWLAERLLLPVAMFLSVYPPPILDLVLRLPEQRASMRSRATAGVELAAYLRVHARRVALLDAGYLPYASGVYAIDLGGLTDPGIARLAGGHIDKRIDEALLRARDPDAFVLHTATLPVIDDEGRLQAFTGYPVEERIARMPWVREEFRAARYFDYAPGYGYVVLARIPKR